MAGQGVFKVDRTDPVGNNRDMNKPQKTCCMCGNVPTFINFDELDMGGIIVCAGFCSVGLDVDLCD